MTEIDLLLKLGGSILTDKSKVEVVNHDLMIEIVGVLKQLYDRGLKFVLVTGVGNAGHQVVASHGVHKGDDGSLERRLGLLHAQIQVNKLRNTLLEVLHEVGIPAVQFYTSSIASADKMQPIAFFLDSVAGFLNVGLVPVVSGDVVSDQRMGYSVMSGDVAFFEIVKQWKPKLLIYGTNVDGIYSSDPILNPNATLIPKITPLMIDNMKDEITEGINIDVTGAMRGKLGSIQSILSFDPKAKIHIINLLNPSNLLKVVNEEPFTHTIVQH
ncbi:MAG: isopentenyl phosphate kinase [Candidatus Kariarchaeaceae archaeon]|jgi:isopentenyl phosphate kinase